MATINLPTPKGPNGEGYNRLVEAVQKEYGNGADFIGDNLPDRGDVEAEVGSVVVQRRPISAIINEWTLGVVTAFDDVEWVSRTTSEKFAPFRDQVIAALARRQSNRIVDHFETLARHEQVNLLRRLADTMALQCDEQEGEGDDHWASVADAINTALDS